MILFDYNQSQFKPRKALSLLNLHFPGIPCAVVHPHKNKETRDATGIVRLRDFVADGTAQGHFLRYHILCGKRKITFHSILHKLCRNKAQEVPAITAQRSFALIPVFAATTLQDNNQDSTNGSTAAQPIANYHEAHFQIYRFPLELLEFFLMNDIVAAFHEYFEVIDARSPELLREVFRLRYQVYCLDLRVLEASNYLHEMESDDNDRHSSHILLRHRPSGEFVGTARLILPDPLNPEKLFPIEQHTQFDPTLFDINALPRQHTAEISRLLVMRQFRRRRIDNDKSESKMIVEESGIKKPRRFPHPILALVVGIIRMCAEHNITRCLSVMDPSLNRLLGPYGLQFDPVGPMTDYHGPRRPYHVNLTGMLDRMYENHNQIWELLTDYGRVRPMRGESVRAPASVSTILADH